LPSAVNPGCHGSDTGDCGGGYWSYGMRYLADYK
jgi:hypothetical protein